jgi:hypothetical protein
MEKRSEDSSNGIISDGTTTPSACKDLEEQCGLIEPGTSIKQWEAWQKADQSQKTSQK